ncbi:MAG: hypothetical protein FJY73_05755 [Candidatus Eisenbacteria bacterium]|nr:hypothetical protein [Candidatus Eisenbacteria bacterium]
MTKPDAALPESPRGTVICTGISKIDKVPLLREVAEEGRRRGARVEVHDVGSMLLRKAEILGVPYRDEKILDAPDVTLKTLRAAVFEEILKNLSPDRVDLVSLHACFRWEGILLSGFDPYYLNLLKPSLFLTLVDDLRKIEERMEKSRQWKGRLTRAEIVDWQNVETFVTQTMSAFLNRPFYMIPKAQPVDSLWKLIVRPEHPKAYLSYPISALFKKETGVDPEAFFEEVRAFRDFASRFLVLFDPMSIKDLDMDPETGGEGADTALLKKVTVWRDFTFINQSDIVIVYNPYGLDSPGVNDEVFHGFSNNKDVYLYYASTRRSPFLESKTTRIFTDLGEMKEFLLEKFGPPHPGEPSGR